MYDNVYIVSGTIVLIERMTLSAITNLREENGTAIANQDDQIKKVNDHTFKVKSQSGSGFYEVKATPNGMTCDCPDFVYRGGKCKHIQATRYYLEIEKDTSSGTVTEKVHLTYTQAWNAYHKLSNIEATNAAIKRKFGETLKSKNPTAQVNELLAKIIAYNLTVVIHGMYENGIHPEFLQLKSEDCN